MNASSHYLLFSEASCSAPTGTSWRFVLQNVESSRRMVASDHEPVSCGERLELLAVVRGLEALDGPARVTLVTKSRYVSRGIKHGLAEWRANEWRWERFGRIVPVKDSDLWQRVDRALLFHEVDCQAWQFETAAESSQSEMAAAPLQSEERVSTRRRASHRIDANQSVPAKQWRRRASGAARHPVTKGRSDSLLGRALHWKEALKDWGTSSGTAIQGAA